MRFQHWRKKFHYVVITRFPLNPNWYPEMSKLHSFLYSSEKYRYFAKSVSTDLTFLHKSEKYTFWERKQTAAYSKLTTTLNLINLTTLLHSTDGVSLYYCPIHVWISLNVGKAHFTAKNITVIHWHEELSMLVRGWLFTCGGGHTSILWRLARGGRAEGWNSDRVDRFGGRVGRRGRGRGLCQHHVFNSISCTEGIIKVTHSPKAHTQTHTLVCCVLSSHTNYTKVPLVLFTLTLGLIFWN